jgi:hypothetical protein
VDAPDFGMVVVRLPIAFFACRDDYVAAILDARRLAVGHFEFRRIYLTICENDQKQFGATRK